MQTKELRDIFQRAIQHTLHAGMVLSVLSCAADPKEPKNATPPPNSTPSDPSTALTLAPASAPTTISTSLPETLATAKAPNKDRGNSHEIPDPPPGYALYSCREGDAKIFTGVTPKDPAEYLELPALGDSFGEACQGAKDAKKCTDTLEKTRAKSGNKLLATRGDKVLLVDKGGIKKFLGGADTPQEAALIAYLNGIDVCNKGVSIKSEATEKFEFRLQAPNCTGEFSYAFEVTKKGDYKLLSEEQGHPCRGRRPEGLCEPARQAAKSAGEFFAEAAWQEAVSVPAFLALARDLRHLQAPKPLIEAALSSARDERRHAKQMSRLAARFGAKVTVPEVKDSLPKSLLSLALENEREGCVNETFAALLAWYQAETATDEETRALLRQIAEDETRHSQLAFEVRGWLIPHLSEAERQLLEATRQQTIERLGATIEFLPEEVAATVGWPSLRQSLSLLRQLQQQLWA